MTFGKMAWNSSSQSFIYNWGESYTPYNIVKVRADRDAASGGSPDERLPLIFAPALRHTKVKIGAEAVASFQPCDIMVVLDFSASMNDDSSFGRISTLGETMVISTIHKSSSKPTNLGTSKPITSVTFRDCNRR